jgi:hypothetical protein
MKSLLITEEEKSRILGMHKLATSNHYLNEQTSLSANTVAELWRQVVSKVGDSKWSKIFESTPEKAGQAFIGDNKGKKIAVGKTGANFGFTVKPVNGYPETEEEKKLSDVVKSLVNTIDQSKNQWYLDNPEYAQEMLYPYEFKYYPLVASDVDKVVELINKLIPILNL